MVTPTPKPYSRAWDPPKDPNCLEGPGRTAEEVARNARELDAVAPTPADKFALMFGASEQEKARDLLDRMAGALSACLNTYPDLRTPEVHEPLFEAYRAFRNRKS